MKLWRLWNQKWRTFGFKVNVAHFDFVGCWSKTQLLPWMQKFSDFWYALHLFKFHYSLVWVFAEKTVIFEAKYSGPFLAKIQLTSLFVADIQILKGGRPEKVTFKIFCRHIFEQHVGGASWNEHITLLWQKQCLKASTLVSRGLHLHILMSLCETLPMFSVSIHHCSSIHTYMTGSEENHNDCKLRGSLVMTPTWEDLRQWKKSPLLFLRSQKRMQL